MGGGGKGGGKGGAQYQYSQSSTDIPDWLEGAAQRAVGRAEDLSNQAYQPYTGQLVASTPQDTQQAYQQIRDMQGVTNPLYQNAAGIYGNLAAGATPQTPEQLQAITNQLYSNWNTQAMQPIQGLLDPYLKQGPATAEQVASNAQTIMNPYTSMVVDPSIKLGQQQLAQNLQQIGLGASQAGAFGGSRQGVQEGVAQSQTATQLAKLQGDLLSAGWGQALDPATRIALQGGQQGMSAAQTLADLYKTGYTASQGAGQHLMDQNTQAALAAAQNLPGLAQNWQSAMQKDASLLQTIGAAQQNQQQAEINAQMGQFYEQQLAPYQQLQALLGAVGSVPYSSTTTSQGYGSGTPASAGKSAAAGALGGAAQGAAMGSVVPGWGTAIGAVVGGILGALS